jgi:hypothetical protein
MHVVAESDAKNFRSICSNVHAYCAQEHGSTAPNFPDDDATGLISCFPFLD